MNKRQVIRFGFPLLLAGLLVGVPFLLPDGQGLVNEVFGILMLPGFVLAALVFWGGVHGNHPGAYLVAMIALNFAAWYFVFFGLLSIAMSFRRNERTY